MRIITKIVLNKWLCNNYNSFIIDNSINVNSLEYALAAEFFLNPTSLIVHNFVINFALNIQEILTKKSIIN